MITFKRQVNIRDTGEAEALCELVSSHIPGIDFYEVAETFGCEFKGDDHGEVVDPDFSPMIGLWYVHFETGFDRVSATSTKYVFLINPKTQNMTDIVAEYVEARNYIMEHAPILDKAKKEGNWSYLVGFDFDKFHEMDKRRDLVTGDLNQYVDYSSIPNATQWL